MIRISVLRNFCISLLPFLMTMHVRDAGFLKYCRAKKATEKLKVHAEYKVLRNEVKMKTKQAKKILPADLFEKNKTDLSKTWKPFTLLLKWDKKVNVLHAP